VTRLIVLVGIAVILVWPIRAVLLRARWTELVPRAAILLWQAIGLAVGVALLGACFVVAFSWSPSGGQRRRVSDFTNSTLAAHTSPEVSSNLLFGLTAGLVILTLVILSVVVRVVGLSRTRSRQRLLIDLLGDQIAGMPWALVLDHPRAAAFSMPGLRPRVVVSSGAIDALASDELAAVLAHERAHLRARHDLVILPFRSLAAALPRCRALGAVSRSVASLLEMAADDKALRECGPNALARALCTLATADSSPMTVAPGTDGTARRVERALAVRQGSKLLACGSAFSALGVLAAPIVVLFAPLGLR
jgi:Zn-dependent protease with chaperone function